MRKTDAEEQSSLSKKNEGQGGRSKLAWTRVVGEWLSSGFGSVCIHVIVIALLFLAFRSSSKGGIGGNARNTDEVGIVFRETLSSPEKDAQNSKNADSETREETTAQTEESQNESEIVAREVVESFLPSNEIGVSPSKASSFQNALSAAQATSASSGVGQRVGFGGTQGVGRTFVYVVDHSESMNWGGGAPLRCAVAEAVESIKSLDPKQGASKFQVIVFNHESEVFDHGKTLIDVTPSNKERATRYLRSLVAIGGTAPEQALELAIRQKPDVVFFLTDADEELTEFSLERIRTLRRQFKVAQICVVEFGRSTEPSKSSFKRLAGENGGAYSFKDVDRM